MSKKTTPARAPVATTAAVAVPASTGTGVTTEINTADALKAGHQNDDLAGDKAADAATRPVVAVGAVVEPLNPALATKSPITGDAAGDAAAINAGASAFPRLVTPALQALLDEANVATDKVRGILQETGYFDQPEYTIAEAIAETGCEDFAELVDMAKIGMSLMAKIDIVTSDGVLKDWTPAEDPAEIVDDLIAMLEPKGTTDAGLFSGATIEDVLDPDPAKRSMQIVTAAGYTGIRIASKVDGFRRGGMAHGKEPAEYPLSRFTPEQFVALMDDPRLVTDLIR